MKGDQLALPVQLPQAPGFDNFFIGPNADAVIRLRDCARASSGLAMLLCGGARTGKTHLLRAATAAAGGDARFRRLAASCALDNLTTASFVALDDIDEAAADAAQALELLRLIDARSGAGLPLLLAARSPPAHLLCALPDLRTRLQGMVVIGLQPLGERDRIALLHDQASERGLELPDDSARWLLTHLARDAGTLLKALETLDQAALSAQRRLTLPFVSQILAPSQPPVRDHASAQTASD